MSSYFFLELDTISPQIEIYAPQYTTPNITNTIIVKSDEPLSDFQEIYALDSNNVRYNYVFTKNKYGDEFVGRIKFNEQPIGLIRIFARVMDEVHNLSNLAVKTIEIKESIPLLKIKDSVQIATVNTSLDNKRLKITETTMNVNSTVDGR